MALWFLIPGAVFLGKVIYDAVTDDSDSQSSSRDYEAEARERERRERRELARKKACLAVYGYLEGQGLEKDESLERLVTADELGSEAGRARIASECKQRFEQAEAMIALTEEIVAEDVAVTQAKLALVSLSVTQSTYRTESTLRQFDIT